MNDLAHWVIGVGNGLLIGFGILGLITLLGWIAESGPSYVPVFTPIWNAMKSGIRRPIDWLDRRITRGRR